MFHGEVKRLEILKEVGREEAMVDVVLGSDTMKRKRKKGRKEIGMEYNISLYVVLLEKYMLLRSVYLVMK